MKTSAGSRPQDLGLCCIQLEPVGTHPTRNVINTVLPFKISPLLGKPFWRNGNGDRVTARSCRKVNGRGSGGQRRANCPLDGPALPPKIARGHGDAPYGRHDTTLCSSVYASHPSPAPKSFLGLCPFKMLL